jgi:hypothetical protein
VCTGLDARGADATIPCKQGAAWVGTAPVHMLQSVARTAAAGLRPEFQKIHPSADGKMTCAPRELRWPSANVDRSMAAFAAGERNHAAHWRSMYQTAICDATRPGTV